jgi:branched-chain amino acid transport system permease protein
MRGCRGTSGHNGKYGIDDLADDIEAFVEALQIERFHLVGHSIGGAIALEYALRFPARVTGLDLVSPAPGDSLESMTAQDTHSGWVLRQFDPHRPFDRATLLTMLRIGRDFGTNRPYFRKRLQAFMPGADLEAVGFERLVRDASAMEPLAILGLYSGLADWDVRARCAQVSVPTRVLAGALDVLVPPESLEVLAHAMPNATYELLPEVGHCAMLEQPERFAVWLAVGLVGPDHPSTVSARAVLNERRAAMQVVVAPPRGFWKRLVGVLGRVLESIFKRAPLPMLSEDNEPLAKVL